MGRIGPVEKVDALDLLWGNQAPARLAVRMAVGDELADEQVVDEDHAARRRESPCARLDHAFIAAAQFAHEKTRHIFQRVLAVDNVDLLLDVAPRDARDDVWKLPSLNEGRASVRQRRRPDGDGRRRGTGGDIGRRTRARRGPALARTGLARAIVLAADIDRRQRLLREGGRRAELCESKESERAGGDAAQQMMARHDCDFLPCAGQGDASDPGAERRSISSCCGVQTREGGARAGALRL